MMTEQIATKIKEELKKMNNSKDPGYTKTYIPWRNNDGFSVECVRLIEDEDGETIDYDGKPFGFQIYYQRDGKDEDCCSLECYLGEHEMNQIDEFVKMYA